MWEAETLGNFSKYLNNVSSPVYFQKYEWRDAFIGFFYAIDWDEPFIRWILYFHLAIILLAIFTRKYYNMQVFIWICLLGLIYCASYINEYGAEHYFEFATQDYFDPRGVFISFLFSLPLIAITLGITINFVWFTSTLLIEVKRAEMRYKRKQEQNNKKEN